MRGQLATRLFNRLTSLACVLVLLGLGSSGGWRHLQADETADAIGEDHAGGVSELEDSFGLDRLFVPRWRLTDGPQVHAAFRDIVDKVRQATVCVHCNGKHTALGGIISPQGWIITKATPLCGQPTVVLADGRKLAGQTVAVDGKHDLALLKVEAQNLPALDMSATASPAVGSFLASVGRDQDPVAVGIVSVAAREIPPQPGRLGVKLDLQLPLVVAVLPESPAEEAGVKAGDRIFQVAGKSTPTRAKLMAAVGSFNPGDQVEFTIEREGKQLQLKATLGSEFPGLLDRSEFQNSLGGKLSVRRFGFPLAFQHDTPLRPSDCGGPVVDIDGRLVGFNIARSGRTESYALPVSEVQQVANKLIAANLTVKKKAATPASVAPANPAGPAK
jgi:serine protease Do